MFSPSEVAELTKDSNPSNWTELDSKAVATARMLAADAVENCGSGHPGTAMSLAPLAYSLYQRLMRIDPADAEWAGRDRFVLSAGHASLLQYIQLYLAGYGLEIEDLKQLRKWGSLTPGHPEVHHTKGVETTTGPLGQGLATAVGMAMAGRFERGLFDPEAPEGKSPFDHFVYVIASDGDVQEGVTSEASSLAGTQQLGNLVVVYDANNISIEDDTDIAFTEDVAARYEAYGWHVLHVDGANNLEAIEDALKTARQVSDKPSLIVLRSVIGFPAPKKMNTGSSHGAALGAEEVEAVREAVGLQGTAPFEVAADVIEHTRAALERGARVHAQWDELFAQWANDNPERKALYDRLRSGDLPSGWDGELPTWEPDAKGIATRKASEATIQALAATLPELWGGSADLAGSNNTLIKDATSFGPESISTSTFSANPYGRNLHFGIREHAMAAVLNGIALHGNTLPYGGTFLIFSEYMRPAVRLAALQNTHVTYVWTHDSIGLGEDGPTHQPVEQLAALRAIPNLSILRPADANETAAAWAAAVSKPGPKGLALTRQNVPVLDGTKDAARDGVLRGGYVLHDPEEGIDVVLLATGSEVALAVEAAVELAGRGIGARVVSMPCYDWFLEQDEAYRNEVIPPEIAARVSVEAGIAMPWYRLLGKHGRAVSLEHFGASADYQTLYNEFGITPAAVVAAAEESIDAAKAARGREDN